MGKMFIKDLLQYGTMETLPIHIHKFIQDYAEDWKENYLEDIDYVELSGVLNLEIETDPDIYYKELKIKSYREKIFILEQELEGKKEVLRKLIEE